jgi:hypothetical protein
LSTEAFRKRCGNSTKLLQIILPISICNVVCLNENVKSALQEVLNGISFSRFLEQVDSKIWQLHLQRVKAAFYMI